jgi:hypothetical protein
VAVGPLPFFPAQVVQLAHFDFWTDEYVVVPADAVPTRINAVITTANIHARGVVLLVSWYINFNSRGLV